MPVNIKSFIPKKSFGQNFLVDQNIIKKIIEACDLQSNETVLEIGPGQGALTKEISQRVQKVIAIEKDRTLAAHLQSMLVGKNVEVIQADILKYDFTKIPPRTKIIGNLPYYISTPIIEKVLEHQSRFDQFFMTVQWEYGQRLVASPNNRDYGSFSLFVQYHSDVKNLFKIKNSSFYPAPKVQSCFLKLDILSIPRYKVSNKELLFKMIQTAFQQRRKTIENSLSVLYPKERISKMLRYLCINPQHRAENLSLKDYVAIAEVLAKE